ncbi:MAG: hypothetical protein HY782_00065 [Chloroflexi bacterium]|nr:hypothetical protein [Chloroflexota bacterium]
MKALSRIGGLLFGILLVIILVPDRAGWQTVRLENLRVVPPATLSVSALPSISATPLAVGTIAPANLTIADSPTAKPAPEPPAILAEDRLAELKAARRALAAAPKLISRGPPSDYFDVFVRLPAAAKQGVALRVLLVLHGMGGRGDWFAEPLIAEADRNNWLLVAPTLPYTKDWKDPIQLMQEDLELTGYLDKMMDELPARLGLKLRQHALIMGFSRGAQLGHRFALFYPEHVESAAVLSAGAYTMPLVKNDAGPLVFPFGIADVSKLLGQAVDMPHFKRISFWVAVGEKDNRSADVSRAFDSSCGKTRVDRARSFQGALTQIGSDARLAIFPNADHEITTDMRSGALRFLRQDEVADNWND